MNKYISARPSLLSHQILSATVMFALLSTMFLFAARGTQAKEQTPGYQNNLQTILGPAVSTSVVVSQIYGGGGNTGAAYKNDFIELFNLGTTAQNLSGWSVQYASATGTSWSVTSLTNVTLQPGQYYLVQEASGGAVGSTLPTADATGSINMSATAGKVALVSSATALSGQFANGTGTGIIDFIGFGTTVTSSEGNTNTGSAVAAAPAPAPSNANGDLRAGAGCTDTDNNKTDFSSTAPTPRNTGVTPLNVCNVNASTNPSGTGAASPASVAAGGTTLLTVTAAQGTNPNAAITGVSGNLTSIGGSAAQAFYDDGTNGDATAGDNVYSYSAAVDAATASGGKTLPVTITDAQSRTGSASIALTVTSSSVSPTATGSANPNSLPYGNRTLLTVTVAAGANPTSTGLAVTGNLSSIGGSMTQTFYDDGTNGDAIAGDNVFSFNAIVAAATQPGAKSLPVTVTDAQSRTGNATINLTVTVPPQVTTAQTLPFSQNWSDTGLITHNGDWNNVPGIIGYRGDGLTSATGTDPQTILADGSTTPVDVTANQTNPNAYTSGGIVEFELTDPVVAFQGSGTASAPNLVINLDTTGQSDITVSYNLRDIDGSADDAAQPVALQYRIGNTGVYTNVPAAFVADASSGPSLATLVTPVYVALPSAVNNQSLVQLRIITSNASGSDEFIGVDDISVMSGGTIPLSGSGSATTSQVQAGNSELLKVQVNPASNPASTGIAVTGDLTSIGGSMTQTFYDDGTNGDATAGDNVYSYSVTIPANAAAGARSIPVSITDAQSRTASTSISFTVTNTSTDAQEHLVMGNPSNAATDVNQPLNYLLAKPQYAVGYNRDRGIPNWVSWHLDASWIGSAARQDDFRPDDTLPSGWYHVQSTDYTGSGFDRGHHSPSADRTRSVPDNSATFLMTNMMPQAPGNNQGPWANLEDYCRSLISGGNELYIIAGGVGTGGKVTVPEYTWKVIMVLPVGDNDVSRVDANTRTIAIIMPNVDSVRPDSWQKYLATVDQVEALTGYDFFSNVPVDIQASIESRLDAASNTAPQTVAGGTYANLTLSSPNTTLTGDVIVTGTLNLGPDTLTTGNYKITLAPGAAVTRESGFVNGNVEKQFDAAPSNFDYPVGTNSGYSPLTVNITALGASPSSLTVKATDGNEPNAPNPSLALKRYWTLTENGDLTANLTFHYLDADIPTGVNESGFRLNRDEGGTFTEVPAAIDAAANTATANGISQFSNWTLLAPAAPTAATVSVSGQVTTLTGRGISGVQLSLTDSNGQIRTAVSTSFGYYHFDGVQTGETYILSAIAKHYTFSQAVQVLNVNADADQVDFTANSEKKIRNF